MASTRSSRQGGSSRSRRSKDKPSEASRPAARRRDEEVLAAATKVFYERGYADASVQDVADELGILKGSLYHYIDTKEDLLFRLLDNAHEEVEAILDDVAGREGLGPLERLELYVREQVLYNARNLAKVSIYYHDMDRLSEARRHDIVTRRRTHEAFVAGLLEEAQGTGEADPSLDANVLSKCIFGTFIWMYRWYRPGGDVDPHALAEVAAAFALRGVVGDVGRSARPDRRARKAR